MIFRFLKRRKERIEAEKEALKLLDENLAKIVTNLVRIAVIERNKEERFEIWEREIVEWLNEIYRKCMNIKYDGWLNWRDFGDAIKNAFWNPKVVYDTALYGFTDRDLWCEDKDDNFERIDCIEHNQHDIYVMKLILSHQLDEMQQLRWNEKTFTRDFTYLDFKLRMP